jgi:hypothetical protein
MFINRNIVLIIFSLVFFSCGGGGSSTPTEPRVPDPPSVSALTLNTAEDTQVTFTLAGTEPTGLALTYAFSSSPSHGEISLSGNQATYNPNANYNGTDTFGYVASSTSGSSTIGLITMTVTPVDDQPSTMDANTTTDEDTSVDITFDFTEVDGQNVTFSVTNNPSYGSVSISGNVGTYTPNQDWNGTDQFNFQVEDASARRILNSATATIVVNSVNDAPVADDVTASMDENKVSGRYQPVTISLNGSDVDGDNLTYSIIDNPSYGSLQADGSATVIYTPNQDYNGEDTFTYKVNDGTVDSDAGTVTVTINAVNDVPTVEDVAVSTNEDVVLTVTLQGTDIENDAITFSIVQDVSNGTSAISSDGVVTYTPNADWSGSDTFTYKGNDGTDDGNVATVTITVNNLNPDVVELNSLTDQWNGSALNVSWSASAENYFSKYVISMGDDDQMTNSSQVGEVQVVTTSSFSYSAAQGKKKYFTLTVHDSYGGSTESSPVLGESFYKFEKAYDTGRGNTDYLTNLNSTSDGGFIAVGRSDLGSGSYPLDAVVMKVDQFGALEWSSWFGNTDSNERITSVVEAGNGDFILTGYLDNGSDQDIIVARYTSSGAGLWAYFYNFHTLFDGSSDGLDNGTAVYEDSASGNIYIYGAGNVHAADGFNNNYWNPILMILDSSGSYVDGSYWYWDSGDYAQSSAYFGSVDHSPSFGDEMVHIELYNNTLSQWEGSIAYTDPNDPTAAFSWIDFYDMDIDDVKRYGDWHSIYGNAVDRDNSSIHHRAYTNRTEDFAYSIDATTNSFYSMAATHHQPISGGYLATGYGLSSNASIDSQYRGLFFKTDNSGNFLWGYQQNAFDTHYHTVYMQIAESQIDGGVVIGGYTKQTSTSDWDFYFVKYNDEGQRVMLDFDNGLSNIDISSRGFGSMSISEGKSSDYLSGKNSYIVNAIDNSKTLVTEEMKLKSRSDNSSNKKLSYSERRRLMNIINDRNR